MTRIYIAGGFAAGLLLAGWWIYGAGQRQAETERAAQDGADYIEGTKDADDATGDLPADDDGLVGLLRRLAGQD